jgi:Macrocin-O-methyltransferase (TylF)
VAIKSLSVGECRVLVKIAMKRAVNEIMFHLPHFRFLLLERYQYMFEPDQLIQICMLGESCGSVEGAFLEIGCAGGTTTVFLNKYLKRRGIDKKYFAIDTFHGFEAEDIRCESDRGKDITTLPEVFLNNKKNISTHQFVCTVFQMSNPSSATLPNYCTTFRLPFAYSMLICTGRCD